MLSEKTKLIITQYLADGKTVAEILSALPEISQGSIYGIRKSWLHTRKHSVQSRNLPTPSFYQEEYDVVKHGKRIIGIIGDTHIPFEHMGYFGFVRDTFRKWGVNTIVHSGDLVDNHGINMHDYNPDALSPSDEYKLTKERLPKWFDEFPYVKLCEGNHDKLPARQIKRAGLPVHHLRKNLYDLPDTWEQAQSFDIDGVIFLHGITTGAAAAVKTAKSRGRSIVMGHSHSFAGVYPCPTADEYMYGMNVGCGIDISTYAFEYQKDFLVRPVLSCGVISDDVPYLIPMNTDKYTKRK